MPLIMQNVTGSKLARRLIAVVCAVLIAPTANADSVEWTIAPYLWASGVSLDLTVNDDMTIGGDAAFKDLVDKLDTAFMGHLEGRKGRWGMYLDTIYLDLSDRTLVSVGPGGPILGDLEADASMKMKIYDAGGLYSLSQPGAGVQVDLLGGIRYIDVDIDALLTLPGPIGNRIDVKSGPSETDLMLGARAIGRFAQRWHWALRGDVSMGGSEGTYNGLATVGYTFGESDLFTLTLGYRYMSIEMDGMSQRGRPTDADIVLSGPVLGFVFKF
jgi:hypothetical protein